MDALGVGLIRVTIICAEPCEGWPCFDCEMVVEAITVARGGANTDAPFHVEHKSVEEANTLWGRGDFSDLDAPYFMLDDEVKLNGRVWRSASLEHVAHLLSGAYAGR